MAATLLRRSASTSTTGRPSSFARRTCGRKQNELLLTESVLPVTAEEMRSVARDLERGRHMQIAESKLLPTQLPWNPDEARLLLITSGEAAGLYALTSEHPTLPAKQVIVCHSDMRILPGVGEHILGRMIKAGVLTIRQMVALTVDAGRDQARLKELLELWFRNARAGEPVGAPIQQPIPGGGVREGVMVRLRCPMLNQSAALTLASLLEQTHRRVGAGGGRDPHASMTRLACILDAGTAERMPEAYDDVFVYEQQRLREEIAADIRSIMREQEATREWIPVSGEDNGATANAASGPVIHDTEQAARASSPSAASAVSQGSSMAERVQAMLSQPIPARVQNRLRTGGRR